jgi:hypothetical protein
MTIIKFYIDGNQPAPRPSKSQPNQTIANGQPSGRGGERAEGLNPLECPPDESAAL